MASFCFFSSLILVSHCTFLQNKAASRTNSFIFSDGATSPAVYVALSLPYNPIHREFWQDIHSHCLCRLCSCLSICLSASLFMSICPPVCSSVLLSVHLSVRLIICLIVCLSVYPSVCLQACTYLRTNHCGHTPYAATSRISAKPPKLLTAH